MALKLNDSTAIINRITNLIQGNSDWCAAVWIEATYLAISPDYITAFLMQDAGYTAWQGIFTDASQSNNSYQISASNGGAPVQTPTSIAGLNLVYVGMRKVGTTLSFYQNGIFIGSAVQNMTAVTFTELLLGNDRFGLVNGPIKFFDYVEYSSAKSATTLVNQMNSVGVLVDPADIVAFTPLVYDLLDISGNNNHWLGAGNFSFTVTPPPTGQFPFNAGNLTPNAFSLDNNESIQYNDVPTGSGYSIVETVPPGWQVSYEVSNGSPNTNISLIAGETVVVTVTNRKLSNASSGIYKIVKDKRQDTLWLEDFTGTRDVKIPNPRYKTGLIGE